MTYDRELMGQVRAHFLGEKSSGDVALDFEKLAADHEHACLSVVRRSFIALRGVELKEVSLRGCAPDTQLLVMLERDSKRDTLEWDIWRDGFSGSLRRGGPPEQPEGVGQALLVEVLEL